MAAELGTMNVTHQIVATRTLGSTRLNFSRRGWSRVFGLARLVGPEVVGVFGVSDRLITRGSCTTYIQQTLRSVNLYFSAGLRRRFCASSSTVIRFSPKAVHWVGQYTTGRGPVLHDGRIST